MARQNTLGGSDFGQQRLFSPAALAVLTAAIGMLSGVSAQCATKTFDSCASVAGYLTESRSEAPELRAGNLKAALDFIDQLEPPEACEASLTDRTKWTFAEANERRSRQLQNSAKVASRQWAAKAAAAWQGYVNWVLDLSADQRVQVARGWALESPGAVLDAVGDPNPAVLNRRLEKALQSLAASRVLADDKATLLDDYADFSARVPDAFSRPLIVEWQKWLRAAPDFRSAPRSDSDIANFVQGDAVLKRQWTSFRDFLVTYVAHDPEQRGEWNTVISRVRSWLA